MASVISLEEAARRTGLTRRQIADQVALQKLKIERDPVTGAKGIYPHTLKGLNGYQPPEPAPPPKPTPPPPPPPEPWTPGPAELAALIKLDDRGRAVAIADLVRKHPHLRAWFRDNPLPPVFRKTEPPPPPQAKPAPPPPPPPPIWQTSWETSWQQSWELPPRPPEPPPPAPPKPPEATPPPRPPATQVQPTSSESLGRLLADVLGLLLGRLTERVGRVLRRVVWLCAGVAAVAVIFGLVLMVQARISQGQKRIIADRRPLPPIVRPTPHHRAQATVHHVQHALVPAPSPNALPPLLPPGAGRPQLGHSQ